MALSWAGRGEGLTHTTLRRCGWDCLLESKVTKSTQSIQGIHSMWSHSSTSRTPFQGKNWKSRQLCLPHVCHLSCRVEGRRRLWLAAH